MSKETLRLLDQTLFQVIIGRADYEVLIWAELAYMSYYGSLSVCITQVTSELK